MWFQSKITRIRCAAEVSLVFHITHCFKKVMFNNMESKFEYASSCYKVGTHTHIFSWEPVMYMTSKQEYVYNSKGCKTFYLC